MTLKERFILSSMYQESGYLLIDNRRFTLNAFCRFLERSNSQGLGNDGHRLLDDGIPVQVAYTQAQMN